MARSASPPRTSPVRRRPPRERLEVDERRSQLLSLGLDLFSERAYDAVQMDELARRAGVSKGLLYHYFPTKRDLYIAALRLAAGQLLEVTAPEPAAPPVERARRGLSAYLEFVEQRGPAYVALMRGGIGSDPEVAAVIQETRDAFAGRIFADLPQESATPAVRLLLRGWLGFVEAASLEWVAERAVPRDELLDLLASILFDVLNRVTA